MKYHLWGEFNGYTGANEHSLERWQHNGPKFYPKSHIKDPKLNREPPESASMSVVKNRVRTWTESNSFWKKYYSISRVCSRRGPMWCSLLPLPPRLVILALTKCLRDVWHRWQTEPKPTTSDTREGGMWSNWYVMLRATVCEMKATVNCGSAS